MTQSGKVEKTVRHAGKDRKISLTLYNVTKGSEVRIWLTNVNLAHYQMTIF